MLLKCCFARSLTINVTTNKQTYPELFLTVESWSLCFRNKISNAEKELQSEFPRQFLFLTGVKTAKTEVEERWEEREGENHFHASFPLPLESSLLLLSFHLFSLSPPFKNLSPLDAHTSVLLVRSSEVIQDSQKPCPSCCSCC